MKKFKRILALILILSMFLGDVGQSMTLTAYADDDVTESIELTAEAEAPAVPEEETAPEETVTEEPAAEEAPLDEPQTQEAEAPAVPSVHKLEGIRLDTAHKLSVEGYLPADDALSIVCSLYQLKEPAAGKELLWNYEFRFADEAFAQQGSYLLTLQGDRIAELIDKDEISSLHLVYDFNKHAEAELVEAKTDAVTFKTPRLELLAVYLQTDFPDEEPVHETEETLSDEQELENLTPDNAAPTLPEEDSSEDPILESFAVTPVESFTNGSAADIVNAAASGKDLSFNETHSGSYAGAFFDGTYRFNRPTPNVSAATPAADEGCTVLEAWNISNLSNQTSISVTMTLNALPSLEAGESLAVYSCRSNELLDLVASDFGLGESVTIMLNPKGATGVALVKLAAKDAEGNIIKNYIPSDALFANDDIYLTGKMPKHGVVVATPVTVQMNGVSVLAAYDISIYANENQRQKGKTWQPAGSKVQVHLIDDALRGESRVGVYHLADGATEPEFVTTAAVDNGQVVFEAESFSTYIFTTLTAEIVATDGNTYRITVEYDLNAGIPMEGTELLVTEIAPDSADYAYYKSESAKAAGTDTDHIALSRSFDIKIVDAADHTRVYEPRNDVSVAITLVGSTLTDYIGVHVVHFDDGGDAKRMDASVSADTVSFLTDSFSVYVVGGSVNVRTYYFWTLNEYREYVEYYMENGTETPTNFQIIRSGESLVLPQTPINPQDPEATFSGWYERTGGDLINPTLETERYSFNAITFPTNDGDRVIHLHAKFTHYAYVIFHEQYDEDSDTFPIAFTRRVDTQSLVYNDIHVNVNNFSVSYQDPLNVDDNQMIFVGWSATPISVPGSSEDDLHHAVTKVETESNGMLLVTGTTHLYPIFHPVKWIAYYSGPSGSGATFVADTPYEYGEGPRSLPGVTAHDGYAAMKRDGAYTFAGWYVGPTDNNLVNGELPSDLSGYTMIANANGTLVYNASAAGISVVHVNAQGENPAYDYIRLTSNVRLYAAWTNTAQAIYKIVVVKLVSDANVQNLPKDKQYKYAEDFILHGEAGTAVDLSGATLTAAKGLSDVATYNSVHGTSLAAEDNPYKDYTFNSTKFAEEYETAPTIAADNSTIIFVRYDWTGTPPAAHVGTYALNWVSNIPSGYTADHMPSATSATNGASLQTLSTTTDDANHTTPTCSVEGAYTFTGWYMDEDCTARVFFHEPTAAELVPLQIKDQYNATTGKYEWDGHSYEYYSVMTEMPAANMTFYAGWEPAWYVVTLDPNYGALYSHVYVDPEHGDYTYDTHNETVNGQTVAKPTFTGTGATWFWAQRDELIQEYYTVKRDYLESDSGSWYYVNHAGDGHGNSRWSDRYTYYTRDPDEATEFTTFEYETGAYRYAGWYEVLFDEQGNEIGEASERYDFTQGVTHDITLRLRWMRVGAFYVSYNPVVTQEGETLTGTLSKGNENELLYLELDGDSYADDADVVLTHGAVPPEGYEFVGWKIRRDESETVYRVGETFHLLSAHMATVQGKRTVFLDAVYRKVQTATVVYHPNGGTMIANNANLTNSIASEKAKVYGGYTTDFNSYSSALVREYYPHETLIENTEENENTILLGRIINNSSITLSQYQMWLTPPAGTTFAGWCENKIFDPKDTEHPLLSSGGTYRVGANDGSTESERVVHLYAIWQTDVNYHLNAPEGKTVSFGGTWDATDHNNQPIYALNGDTYTQHHVHIDSVLGWPPKDPVCTSDTDLTFLGWATREAVNGSYVYTLYNFTARVPGPLDLYALWGAAPSVQIKVLDTTDFPTVVYAPWTADTNGDNKADGDAWITLTTAHQTPRELCAAITVTAQRGDSRYGAAFATVQRTGVDIENVQEDPIEYIYYSPRDGKVHLGYGAQYNTAHGTPGADVWETTLDANETIYMLYYKVKTPQIHYMLMETSGFISVITNMLSSGGGMNRPTSVAQLTTGGVVMPNEPVTISSSFQPMNWLASPDVVRNQRTGYSVKDSQGQIITSNVTTNVSIARSAITYYNFCIGASGAENSVELAHKTQAYTGNETGTDARPDILIKNTWRGIRFSQDGGNSWFDAGIADPWLYVVYYTETPTVITLYNSVVGLPDDMHLRFDYDYWVEEIRYDSNNNVESETLIFTTRNPKLKTVQADIDALTDEDRYTQHLVNGETFSAFTTTTAAHTYRITITVKEPNSSVGQNDHFGHPTVKITYANLTEPNTLANTTKPGWVTGAVTASAEYCYDSSEKDNTFSYTVTNNGPFCGKTALIMFTNTRSSVNVDLHVAKADLNGNIYHSPEWRVPQASGASSNVWDDTNAYTVQIPLGQTLDLTVEKPYTILTQNVDPMYKPGALIYGKDRHTSHTHHMGEPGTEDAILLEETALSCYRIAYELVDPSNPYVYNLYIKDGTEYRYPLSEMAEQIVHNVNGLTHENGDVLFYRLFYLFYPAITVYYVIENNDGSLTQIVGEGGTAPITYNGSQAVLNGVNVTQRQEIGIWERSLMVSQEIGNDENGNAIFNMPPLLDMWDATANQLNKLNLVYYKLGATPQDNPGTRLTNISQFRGNKNNGFLDENDHVCESGVTESLVIQIGIVDHRLQWQFPDEPSSTVLSKWPVLYAIYRERGYDLTVTKTVSYDTGYEDPFPITITSKSITRDEYKVEGTGYNVIEAVPAQLDGSNNLVEGTGLISFSVKDGDSITIKGLSAGDDYVITEGRNTNYILSAQHREAHTEGATWSTLTPTGNTVLQAVDLEQNTEVLLTNTPKKICRIGGQEFCTLNDAINYIDTLIGDQTATIEMLTDYLMPASDAPEIPTHLTVTLTTANDYVGTGGAGGKATITRDFTNGAMFTNRGTFTLGDVILDGGYVSSDAEPLVSKNAMIENDGTLTLGGPVTRQNLTSVTEGEGEGATTVPVLTEQTLASTAPVMENAKTSGNGGAVYVWKGTLNVYGGSYSNCHANRGGVIYAASGDVNIGGGSMTDNYATLGGAVYYVGSGSMNISNGTIGTSGYGNTANSGGAVYMASGTANMTGGTIAYNTATVGSGGGIYALNAYVNISGGSVSNNTAYTNGGAVNMDTLTLTISDTANVSNNTATNGNGGAVMSGTGTVVINGGTVSSNHAGGNGGAVYTQSSAFEMSEGTISSNTAHGSGGGVYAQSGSVTIEKGSGASSSPTISGNTAGYDSGEGSGGGVYAGSGAVTMTEAKFTSNTANGGATGYSETTGLTTYAGGTGGAVWIGSGASTLTNCTFGGNSNSTYANRAINGAAIFTDTAYVTLAGDTVTYNVATGNGGAVGVGSPEAKLIFSGNVVVRYNTKNDGTTASNVYLDQDTDTVINTNTDGIGKNAYIGIYVPSQNVTVNGETENLVDRRGVPSAYFGSYVNGGNGGKYTDKFKNDRSDSLSVTKDTSALKLYWTSNFKVEVKYINKFTNTMPTGTNGDNISDVSNDDTFLKSYNPPDSNNTSSDIAEDIRAQYKTKSINGYIFGLAIAVLKNTGTAGFDNYITDVNWSIEHNCWEFKTRKGDIISGTDVEKLVVYYSNPSYLSIENNTDATLTITSFQGKWKYSGNTQTFHELINDVNQTDAGYGYIYAIDGTVQDVLRPITSADLVLYPGDSLMILAPGGQGMEYKVTGSFDKTYTSEKPLTIDLVGQGQETNHVLHLDATVTANTVFTLGKTDNPTFQSDQCCFSTSTNRKEPSELIFGGSKTICRIVTDNEISGAVQGTDFVRCDDGTGDTAGKKEYTFATLNQAVAFVKNKLPAGASNTIEMTKDYLIPSSDKVTLNNGKSITFSTSVTGTHQYDPEHSSDATRRATISRGTNNSESFIVSTSGNLTDTLTIKNLIFDGKEFSGGAKGSIISTKDWIVVVDNCRFENCVANDGGGIYIAYTRTNANGGGSLSVSNTDFYNCKSTGKDRQGGGAIWSDTKSLTVSNCHFTNCFGTDQGGAIFHRIDTSDMAKYQHSYAAGSSSTFTGCYFTGCESRTGGGVESDAHIVSFTNCHFTDCYSTKTTKGQGSGGAIGTYIYEKASYVSFGSEYPNTSLTVIGCTFTHCTATEDNSNGKTGHGGAIRSHSMTTIVRDSVFNDCRSLKNGGAIAINNGTATSAEISGCSFSDCSTSTMNGGAIYCDAITLTLGTVTKNGEEVGNTITNCSAAKDGGGVYHYREANGLSLTARKLTVDRCTASTTDSGSSHGGGGLYTVAPTVTLTDCSFRDCTTPGNGGGVHITPRTDIAANVTLDGTSILSCTAKKNGGGLYLYSSSNANLLTIVNCRSTRDGENNITALGGICNNKSEGKGGGVYTNEPIVELKNSEIMENQSGGDGGGVCQDNTSTNVAHGITVDGSTVSGNISGGKGGGIYTGSNMTLKGLQIVTRTTTGSGESAVVTTTSENIAQTSITGNRLTTSNAQDAAGVYLNNGVKLFLKLSDGSATSSEENVAKLNYALLTITGNKTVTGGASDLRLPEKNNVNDIKVDISCGVQGEIRVVNAKRKLTQFGTMTDPTDVVARHGFTDEYKVFWSDDGELFGIIDRSDTTYTKVIWGGDPICKITDANGRLLYLDENGNTPAVFDILDDGTTNAYATSAFGTLRSGVTLYHYTPGSNSLVQYLGNEFIIKMLVEEYSASEPMTLMKPIGPYSETDPMIVTLTTAKTGDEMYPYRGREGTRCTILRDPLMNDDKAMLTFGSRDNHNNGKYIDLTLQNIVLDGGAENGVTAQNNTRIITANAVGSKGRNATLQKAEVDGTTAVNSPNGKGGGVYLNNGAQLFIEGGAIRNCSAVEGGGVYIDGNNGAMTLSSGTITYCTATANGGGVYFNNGQLQTETPSGVTEYTQGYINITGGSISRCSAAKGGGIYLNGGNSISNVSSPYNGTSRQMFMSGGSILYNHATANGGGIAVGDENCRITFSNAPFVYRNTCDTSEASDNASNVQMDQAFDRSNLNPGTVIVSRGLIRGSAVGVYVPGADSGDNYPVNNPTFDSSATLYDMHGAERDPFATFEGTKGDSGMNYFINDRNGMKGGKDSTRIDNDQKIYWRKIYSLTVTKKVISDEAVDANKVYYFEIQLSGSASTAESDVAVITPGTDASQINDIWIGGVKFTAGKASFGLHDGDTIIFDLLPLGYSYRITEKIPKNTESGYFQTSVTYYDTQTSSVKTVSGMTVNGKMTNENHFSYDVTFYNLHAVCKITDENGELLYRESEGEKLPAVYSILVEAFNKVNGGDNSTWYTIGTDGVLKQVHPSEYRIEMLIDEYVLSPDVQGLNEYMTVQQNKNVVFTTAEKDSDDGYPFLGENRTAKIRFGYSSSNSMLTVAGGSSLTLDNIILDGGSRSGFASSADGGLIHVDDEATFTVGTGVTLCNTTTSGDGAAVYLDEGAEMNISGAPVFEQNISTGVSFVSGDLKVNGEDTDFYYNGTPQDIYIAGYTGSTAESLVVTGNLTYADPEATPIYIWAADSPHYIQNQQFAVLSGGEWTGLNVFRNAQTNKQTQNPLRGTPKYLYGIARDDKVFWSGSMDLTVVKNVTGEFADSTQQFTFTVHVSEENSVPFEGTLDYARYQLREGSWDLTTPSLTGNPYSMTVTSGDNGNFTFTLTHNEKIVVSIPRGLRVTVSETQEQCDTSYVIDNGSSVTRNTTTPIVMNGDTEVVFTNHFAAVAPSGLRMTYVPFLFMALAGVALVVIVTTGRKRRKEKE